MTVTRREFLGTAAAGIATGLLAPRETARAAAGPKLKAVAFDAFAVFDPRPVFALAQQLFPGRGSELAATWRTRQFEYQWLRALSGHYADFWQTTDDALVFACEMLKVELTPDARKQLMDSYLGLKAWPDAPQALRTLKESGLKLAFLSNATPKILDAGIKNSGLAGVFDHVLSTDAIKTYKPDPRAYRLAIDAFGSKREEIVFVAFAGWDAAGAKSFGYTTFWVNRQGFPPERLGIAPDGAGQDLTDLVKFMQAPGRTA